MEMVERTGRSPEGDDTAGLEGGGEGGPFKGKNDQKLSNLSHY